MNIEDLYRLVDAVPEGKWKDVERYLKVKAMPVKSPTDDEIEDLRKSGIKYGIGEYYKKATIDELRAGFKRVNEMIMNRDEFNNIFDVTVSEKRWVSLKTYLRDLNQPENIPTADEVETFRLYELEKDNPDYVTLSHEELFEYFMDDCEEEEIFTVNREDLLQTIDGMTYEQLQLLNDFVEGLKK